jgi:hypothetical protein
MIARRLPFLALALVVLPALGACASNSATTPAAPAVEAAPAAPEAQEQPKLTRAEAAEQCWMSVEKKNKNLSLDQRADIVTKCIDEKLNGPPPAAEASPPRPKSPKSKT